jgi:hypothetical protein
MGSLPNTERGLYKKFDELKNSLDNATAENNQLKKSLDEQKKSLDEQKKSLDNATAENNQLRYHLDSVIAENNAVKTDLDKLKYPDSNTPEIQAKRAGDVPYIKPTYMYAQIESLELDMSNLDPRLEYVAQLVRTEPYFRRITTNFFYKFHVTPPPDEKKFTTEWRQNRQVEIPFPATLLLRCQKDENNKLIIHGIYVVSSITHLKINKMPNSAELIGIVKLEKKKDFYERDQRDNKPVTRIDGTTLHFDLKIKGHLTEMVFPNPNEHELENLHRAITPADTYELTRFHIYDIDPQEIKNSVKKITSVDVEKKKEVSTTPPLPPPSNTLPSSKPDISKGLSSAAIAASRFFTRKLVEGGKRRKNIKYKTKKMKYKKYKKNKNRKTIVKMK